MQKDEHKALFGEQRLHYKMYKSGKRWLLAGIAGASLITITFVAPHSVSAATDGTTATSLHADMTATVSQQDAALAQSQDTATVAETTQQADQTTSVPADDVQDATADTQSTTTSTQSDAVVEQPVAATENAQTQTQAEQTPVQPVTLTATAALDDGGKATVAIVGPANAVVHVTDSEGRAIASLHLDVNGRMDWVTRASGEFKLTTDEAAPQTVAVNIPTATAQQSEQTAAGAAQLHTNNRDAIVSGSLAERSKTQLDTDEIDPEDFVKSNQTNFGGDFTDLNAVADNLTDKGVGEKDGKPVTLATVDDTVPVNVVTEDSSIVSGSILGTSNTYDVIQLAKGISAQIIETNGKKVALVTAKLAPSISDIIPLYDTLKLLVGNPIVETLSLGASDIVLDMLNGLDDITTLTTTAPVRSVESSKLANGDYSKFVVDLSGINVVQLIEDKLETVVGTYDPTGILSGVVDEDSITGDAANAIQGIGTGSLLGETTVVTPLNVRATTEINDSTDPQDISIASAFYTDDVFEFEFGASPDTNYYPLKIQLADKDNDGHADITETGKTDTNTGDNGGEDTDNGGDTTPEAQNLSGTAVIEKDGSVTITGIGAKAGDMVWAVTGSDYATADDAANEGTMLGTVDSDGKGKFTINVPEDKAAALYGATITLIDQGTHAMAPVDVPANEATAEITGTLVVTYNGTAPKPNQTDHAGDSIWAQIAANYATNKLTVKVTAGKQTLDVELPDVNDFTWEPGATGYGARVHADDFELTDAGKQIVEAAVAKAFPSATFDVNAIKAGGDLDIRQGTLNLKLDGTIALTNPATTLPDQYQGGLNVQAYNADGSAHGATVALTAGDFALADGVTPTDGVHQNAFVLTTAGLAKLQTALGENDAYQLETAPAGGTLAVASSAVTTYTVHYDGAGDRTPSDNQQSLSWTEKFAADGSGSWIPDGSTASVAVPQLQGFTASTDTVYAGKVGAQTTQPEDVTTTVHYTLDTPTGAITPDDQYVPVTGKTAPNAQVTLTTATGSSVTTTASDDGTYEAIVTRGAAPAGSELQVVAKYGTATSQTLTLTVLDQAPDAPAATITPVHSGQSHIMGKAEANAQVDFYVNGSSVGHTVAGFDGVFILDLSVEKAPVGTTVRITQTTDAGTSPETGVVVVRPDLDAPSADIKLVKPIMEGSID